MQVEYERLVTAATASPAAASSAGAEDADDAATAELRAVRSCVGALKAEARDLLTPVELVALLEGSGPAMVLGVSRALALLDAIEAGDGGGGADAAVVGAMHARLEAWRSGLGVGDEADVFWESFWYRCKVVELAPGATPSTGAKAKIHFMGYKKSHQRWVGVGDSGEGKAIMPPFTHTLEPLKKEARRPAKRCYDDGAAAARKGATPAADDKVAVEVTTNRFGRVVPKVLLPLAKAAPSKARGTRGGGRRASGSGGGGEGGGGGSESEEDSKKVSDDLNDWYCSLCMAFEREDASDEDVLLSCDGPCLRSFHLNCLGIDAVPEDATWVCEACAEREHACFLCGDAGRSSAKYPAHAAAPAAKSAATPAAGHGEEEGEEAVKEEEGDEDTRVTKCSVARCGKFFHRGCIDASDMAHLFLHPSGKPRAVGSSGQPDSFVCAHHQCSTCFGDVAKGSRKAFMYKCHTCPRSFHLNCVPPGSEFHEYCLVCSKCIKEGHELPPLFTGTQSGHGKLGKARFEGDRSRPERALHFACRANFGSQASQVPPDPRRPGDLRHFRLDDRLLRDVESRPPVFQHIGANQYGDVPVPKAEPGGACSCHLKKKAAGSGGGGDGSSSSNGGGDDGGGGQGGASVSTAAASPGKHGTRGLSAGSAAAAREVALALERAATRGHGLCGEDCENRLLRIECCGGPTACLTASLERSEKDKGGAEGGGGSGGGGGARGGSKDKWSNCPVGFATCGNRQIGLKQGTAKVQPFLEEGMGWGLRVLEDLVAGQLVREYVSGLHVRSMRICFK